jgi:threonyl-tRNA synthetase
VSDEVEKLIVFSLDMLKSFGFNEFMIYLSTKPEAAVGEDADWEMATQSLKASLIKLNLDFSIDEGGGAFYGPKIDIKIKDAIGRAWQCTTIQFDFNLPERFDMQYIGADNQAHRPYMIHRAVLGSVERFFATLLEYHGGNLPLWLAPVQMMILPITDAQLDYAKDLQSKLLEEGLRCEVDSRSEKIGYKIRDAELKKIPFMCIVGKREADEGSVTLRRHTQGDLGSMDFATALARIKHEL